MHNYTYVCICMYYIQFIISINIIIVYLFTYVNGGNSFT